jgi:hypothetical protein
MTEKENELVWDVKEPKDPNLQYAAVGHSTTTSETLTPKTYEAQFKSDIKYFLGDLPGLNDSRGTE